MRFDQLGRLLTVLASQFAMRSLGSDQTVLGRQSCSRNEVRRGSAEKHSAAWLEIAFAFH
jgi:hypothetical protein